MTRLLIEKFELGLFENPYVDPDKAEATANCEEFRNMAETAFRKSIVLMRNDASMLPLKKGVKLYVERVDASGTHAPVSVPENKWDVTFVDSPAKADAVVFWVFPGMAGRGGGFLGGASGDVAISNLLSGNNIDVRYINNIASRKPVCVAVNCSRPWALNELKGNAATTWIATFGTTLPALMDVVTGKFNPCGKMPFGLPASQEAVEANKEDLPSFMEAEGYALIPCGAGLSY